MSTATVQIPLTDEEAYRIREDFLESGSALERLHFQMRDLTIGRDEEIRPTLEDVGRLWALLDGVEADHAFIGEVIGKLQEDLVELNLIRANQAIAAQHQN